VTYFVTRTIQAADRGTELCAVKHDPLITHVSCMV